MKQYLRLLSNIHIQLFFVVIPSEAASNLYLDPLFMCVVRSRKPLAVTIRSSAAFRQVSRLFEK